MVSAILLVKKETGLRKDVLSDYSSTAHHTGVRTGHEAFGGKNNSTFLENARQGVEQH